jgi:hypothetical protein
MTEHDETPVPTSQFHLSRQFSRKFPRNSSLRSCTGPHCSSKIIPNPSDRWASRGCPTGINSSSIIPYWPRTWLSSRTVFAEISSTMTSSSRTPEAKISMRWAFRPHLIPSHGNWSFRETDSSPDRPRMLGCSRFQRNARLSLRQQVAGEEEYRSSHADCTLNLAVE